MKIKVKEKINPRHPISRYQGLQKEKKKERKKETSEKKEMTVIKMKEKKSGSAHTTPLRTVCTKSQ